MLWNRVTGISLGVAGLFIASSWLFTALNLIFPIAPQLDWQGSAGLPGFDAGMLLLVVVVFAALASFLHLSITWSAFDAALLLTLSVGISTLAELFSLEHGILFGGSYSYHGGLEPRIAGSLPLAIPLAWFVLSWVPLTLLRPWLRMDSRPVLSRGALPRNHDGEHRSGRYRYRVDCTTHTVRCVQKSTGLTDYGAARPAVSTSIWFRAGACALLLASMDLFIEPLSVYTGLWTWEEPGSYLGAPVANTFSWVIVGVVIYGGFFTVRKRWSLRRPRPVLAIDSLVLGLFVIWVNVALILISTVLDSLLPVWLTIAALGPTTLFWVHHGVRVHLRRSIYREAPDI